MTTIKTFERDQVEEKNPLLSSFKAMIETAFYGNNVRQVSDLTEAYQLACQAPGAIVTDLPVKHTAELGLPESAKQLVFNDGKIVGRTAAARVVIGDPGVDAAYYEGVLREAIFETSRKKFIRGDVFVGLDEHFMVNSHLMIVAGFEVNFYSYLLNFQIENEAWRKRYAKSEPLEETDIYLLADPTWQHSDFPNGLVLFDPDHNVAAVLGLRYFGELKKATLTMAWATAHRNGFVACHGGMKQYHLPDKQFTMASFGLSGSGKSTITLAKHGDKYQVDVLHDDAFIIDKTTGETVALEPAYFDKVKDYPLTDETVAYFLTLQNVGVTVDQDGHKVPILQDIRNGNGRTVKSRYVTPNRVDHLQEPLDAIFWIMKDDSLPPVVKITDPILAAVFGLTLATKHTNAENLVGDVDMEQLVIVPYADPFRIYPLGQDYADFRDLFQKNKIACYVLNTGNFNGKDIKPKVTLGSIEKIIEKTAEFVPFKGSKQMAYLQNEFFPVDFEDSQYMKKVTARMQDRLNFIIQQKTVRAGVDALPDEAEQVMRQVIADLEK